MNSSPIDLSPLRKALATLAEASRFWVAEPASSPLKPHLRSAVVRSYKFTYELSIAPCDACWLSGRLRPI